MKKQSGNPKGGSGTKKEPKKLRLTLRDYNIYENK